MIWSCGGSVPSKCLGDIPPPLDGMRCGAGYCGPMYPPMPPNCCAEYDPFQDCSAAFGD